MELKIKKEFQEMAPFMSDAEFEGLKGSLQDHGYLKEYPIVIDENGVVLDGHQRYRACKELGIVPETISKTNLKDDLEKKEFILITSLRRNLNLWQKAEQAKKWEELEREKAKVRLSTGGAKHQGRANSPEAGKVTTLLAKKVGLGDNSLKRAFKIMEEASEEVKEKLRQDEWTINYAYNGYNAIGKAPADKQVILREQFEKEELMAPQVTKIVEESQKAVELLGNTSEKIQKEFEEKYKDEFWTADLKFKDLLKEVSIAEGNPADCIQREIEQSLMTKDEVSKMAKKVGGYFVGESHYWVIMVDPLLFKEPKKKKIEEDEEE